MSIETIFSQPEVTGPLVGAVLLVLGRQAKIWLRNNVTEPLRVAKRELMPNAGESLKDNVTETRNDVKCLRTEVQGHFIQAAADSALLHEHLKGAYHDSPHEGLS